MWKVKHTHLPTIHWQNISNSRTVEKFPQRVMFHFQGEEWTFQQVEDYSNQVVQTNRIYWRYLDSRFGNFEWLKLWRTFEVSFKQTHDGIKAKQSCMQSFVEPGCALFPVSGAWQGWHHRSLHGEQVEGPSTKGVWYSAFFVFPEK